MRSSRITHVDAQVRQQRLDLVQATAWQTDVLRKFLGTGDDARLVVGRQAHRLRLVELGILKCGQPDEAIVQTGWQRIFGDVDLIAEN